MNEEAPVLETESTNVSEDILSSDGTNQSGSLLDGGGLVGADGNFIPDWYNSDLLPEDLRGNESLKAMKSLEGLAKSYVNTKKMVGGDKISLPKAGAEDAEWQTFFEAVGKANPDYAKPTASSDYVVEVPEELQSLYTDERLQQMKDTAFAIGATKKQFAEYMKADMVYTQQMMQEMEAEAQRKHDEAVLALKKEWGEALPERQHIVKRLISEAFAGNKAGELEFLEKYAGDPAFVRFAANVGVRLVESKALVAELTQETPKEIESKINELRRTPGYTKMNSDMTDEQRSEITRQIYELERERDKYRN